MISGIYYKQKFLKKVLIRTKGDWKINYDCTDEGGDITDYGCSVWGEQTYRREHNSGGSGEQVWNITYNAYGEATKEEKNDGSIWTYEYDERGLVTGKTEPNGTEASYTYDACGRVTKETRSAENSTRTETKSYSYDKNGFMLSATDNGVTTSYNGGTSNAYGLITESSTTAGGKTLVTSYTYDKGLRVSEITYPDTRTVNYTYNSAGFLKAAGSGKKSDGNTTAYAKDGTYNTAGQLMSLTAGNGKTTTRTWNVKEGTLASYSWGLDEYALRALTWDVRGNITSIEKGRADSPYTNTYSYDVRNRLVSETNGAKVSVKSSSLTGASYRHAQNDVSGKADGSLSSQAVSLDYNAASVIIDLGSDREITSLNIYGRNGRIDPKYLEVWTKESSSEGWQKVPVASLSWNKTTEGWCVYFIGGTTAEEIKLHSTWDERDADYSPVDRSTFSALVKNIFEVSFTADGKTSSWIYDAKGNRLSETESTGGIYSPSQSVTYYPNTDLIKTYGEWKFNYDRNGSLTSRGKIAEENQSEEEPFASWIFDASDGEVWYYEYDMSGRMTKSGSSKKGTSGLTERAAYAYDYRGLLVRKTYSDFTAGEGVSITGGSTATVTEWYEYTQDGRLLYTEKSSGSVTTETDYIWAETTLWCEVDDGEVYYHHTDHLGTTEAVTDSKGKVVWHAEYEAFGSVLSENGSMAFTPSFTGKMLDDCSGLYYFNARWYDSEMGRFTTQDPVRDGVNFHNYCNGNPLTRIDWTGLEVKASFIITKIEEKTFGKTAYGYVSVTDLDTGVTISGSVFSGGIPYGNNIPIGTYDILQPTADGHYRLEALDEHYGDDKVEGTTQGLLRFHEKGRGRTMGCASVENDNTWNAINNMLQNTSKTEVEVESKSRNPFAEKKETLNKHGVLSVELSQNCRIEKKQDNTTSSMERYYEHH